MDHVDPIVLVSRWLHLAAVVVMLGGVAFARGMFLPSAAASLNDEQRKAVCEAVRRRWAVVTRVAIVVLLVTGFTNFYLLAIAEEIEPIPYHAVFGPKLLLALCVFFLVSALAGRGAGFQRMRQQGRTWLSVILVLGAVIILLSGVLSQVRFGARSAAPASTGTPYDSEEP